MTARKPNCILSTSIQGLVVNACLFFRGLGYQLPTVVSGQIFVGSVRGRAFPRSQLSVVKLVQARRVRKARCHLLLRCDGKRGFWRTACRCHLQDEWYRRVQWGSMDLYHRRFVYLLHPPSLLRVCPSLHRSGLCAIFRTLLTLLLLLSVVNPRPHHFRLCLRFSLVDLRLPGHGYLPDAAREGICHPSTSARLNGVGRGRDFQVVFHPLVAHGLEDVAWDAHL
jgi:hypothetical protein